MWFAVLIKDASYFVFASFCTVTVEKLRNGQWHEPPPSETVTDTAITSTTETNLTKGSFNEELSCNFSLTADLSFQTVSFEFDGVTVASYAKGRYPTVADRFVSRFNVTWVPSKLTLIVFKVTSDDKREYHCRAQGYSSSHGLQAWLRMIKVDVLGKCGVFAYYCYVH